MMKTDQEQNHDWLRRRLETLDKRIADSAGWGAAIPAMEEERKSVRIALGLEAPKP
jgi:hypothetical protein